jgi:hypothetical protein
LPVLITCNHVINGNENEIKLIFNDKIEKILKLNNTRKIYTNEKKDITIIEIKKEDNYDINNFLEIDYDIFKNINLNDKFKSIYIIHFPNGNESSLSIGLIDKIEDDIIQHKCATQKGSSGAPIINLNNYKIIGIHQGTEIVLSLNSGILLKNIINDFNKIKYTHEKKILYFDNGRYEGDVKNGKMEGKGIRYWNDGDRYEGDFKNDKREGKGISYYNNGDRYEGEFKNDKAEGKGIEYFFHNNPVIFKYNMFSNGIIIMKISHHSITISKIENTFSFSSIFFKFSFISITIITIEYTFTISFIFNKITYIYITISMTIFTFTIRFTIFKFTFIYISF